jgi:hypothetical protein
VLSDFVVEWTEIQTPPKEKELEYWTINFDGSLQLQGAEAGILVSSPKGEVSSMSCKCIFQHPTMQPSMKPYFMVLGSPQHSVSVDSRFSRTQCLSTIRPTRSDHVWTTKCCYIARSFTNWKQFRRSRVLAYLARKE